MVVNVTSERVDSLIQEDVLLMKVRGYDMLLPMTSQVLPPSCFLDEDRLGVNYHLLYPTNST
jgi:hypothetical protein